MRLILSTDPWNANYCTEGGQVIYKVESGPGLINRNMNISRVLPAGASEAQFRDVYELVAEIDYHYLGTSYIKYGGVNLAVKDFFRKGEFSFWGR